MANLPHAALQTAAPWWLFAAAALGAAWVLLPRGMPLRWCGILPILAMILWTPPLLPEGAFRLSVLDIGQGVAVLIETRHHTALYDTGAPHAHTTIQRAMQQGGNRQLDMLMISHDDIDHSGAAQQIIAMRPPKQLLGVLPPQHKIIENLPADSRYVPCRAGFQWQWDAVHFTVLHPPPDFDGAPDNAGSCVIRLVSPYGSALLPGDIPTTSEQQIIATGASLSAAVLLAPHHGSRHSSSAEFLQSVSPQVVIFSAGANNRYGHPHRDAIQRTADAGAAIYRTDSDGAVVVTLDAAGISPIRWRDVYRRYWLKNPAAK